MTIVSQNSLINQYVPTFYIKDLMDGQGIIYDSVRKAFVNTNIISKNPATGAVRLGQLLNVSSSVDNPLALQNGQVLVYNTGTTLWENKFLDFNFLQNRPTSASYRFSGLADTNPVPLANGYVHWDSTGTQLIYSTTIPGSSVTGLAPVAYSGNYNDLTNKPSSLGSVSSVSIVPANGISGVVASPNTTPAITLTLGNITPENITASGTITGSNLSGTNTGDQLISLAGDVTGSGTGTFLTTLSNTGVVAGTYGDWMTIPQLSIDSKGRVTNVSNVSINSYILPSATPVSLGGIKVGSGLSIATDGTLSVSNTEIVVFRYTEGSLGNFDQIDCLFSKTAGVQVNIIDPSNCLVNYSFTGKSNLPKSILTYGQIYSTNRFVIRYPQPSTEFCILGGGSSDLPDIAQNIFTNSNVLTLQSTMADTGTSAGPGQRAYLVVVFGF
jgi:hypothetical protein